jgi:putative ABC transport system permease protein
MNNFNTLSVTLKNIKRKSFRTGVLIFSISLMVSLLVFSISFSISVSSTLNKSANRLGADLIIIPAGASNKAQEFLIQSENQTFYMNRNIIERLKKIKGIDTSAITYQTYLSSIMGICCDVAQTQVVVFDQERDFIVKPWLSKRDFAKLKKGEIIAGFGTYENLGYGMLDVADLDKPLPDDKTIMLKLFHNYFKVVRVLEKTGTGMDHSLFISEENFADMVKSKEPPVKPDLSPLKSDEISVIFAKILPGYDPYQVAKKIDGEIVEVDVVDRRDMGQKILVVLNDINVIFIIAIILSSFLTIFLVWGIFSAIVNERSKEIGIMRAIGAKESQIARLFLMEVFIIGAVGSLIGVIIGTFSGILLTRSFTLLKTISAFLTLFEHLAIALLGLVIGIGICISGAIMPINRIKKIEPLLVIKGE